MPRNVLFLCSQNRLRSPTAEQVFADWPGIAVQSAGLDEKAGNPCTDELVEWADIIFVMERSHRDRLQKRFRRVLRKQRVICLDIADDYGYMDPQLVKKLELTVSPHLPKA